MTNPNTSPRRKRKLWPWAVLASLILVPAAIFALWAAITLKLSYSSEEQSGYVQKLQKRGWICKTWEGQLATANVPGAVPQTFSFTVRNDSVAGLIQRNAGKQVVLTYEQHRGVPTSCFGETQYFVTHVKPAGP